MGVEANIQAQINHGYGIAASVLGLPYGQYRPRSAGPVISNINLRQIINFAADVDPKFSFKAPNVYAHPVHFGLVDYTDLLPGDYLTDGDQYTFFVGNIEPLKPLMCIRCDRVVNVYRPANDVPSQSYYGGNVTGLGAVQLTGWPASILIGPKGERNESALPADPRSPWHVILLPHYVGVTLRTGDVIIDDLQRRYTASACELTYLGWKITAAYSGT